jgi:WD40 repeat protein/tRNA A-37 threonylcarbamoyl transferase component Bud32
MLTPMTLQPSRPDWIEGYDILGEIHRGGQGVVYKAVQRATKRTVALKVLRDAALATDEERIRFQLEIDVVAGLHHPNIVTIYESGVVHDCAYYAMEYVHGRPLDDFMRGRGLSVRETLALFTKVCSAVNYAHQRGVIHRDLKPSNILVDTEGEPRVVDFGLAKVAGTRLASDGRPLTVTGMFMGTVAYASPEQARGDQSLIDIRTDVYSLGVILYESLTGEYPYPVVGQIADVLKHVIETEPKRPSSVRHRIDNEIETIVVKALAKDRGRRYQTAESLLRDIEHYLAGEPIDAKRDSAWYVFNKTVRRHRVAVGIAASFVALLAVAAVTLAFANARVDAQRRAAEAGWRRARAAGFAAAAREAGSRRSTTLATLLAREAVRAEQNVSTLQVLRDALAMSYERAVLAGDRALFTQDGTRIVTIDKDDTVRTWDLQGRPVATIRSPEPPGNVDARFDIRRWEISSDGRWLLWTVTSGVPVVWDLLASTAVALHGHEAKVVAVGFFDHERGIYTSACDGTCRLWSLQGDAISTLRQSPSGIAPLVATNGVSGSVLTYGMRQAFFCVERTFDDPPTMKGAGEARAWAPDGKLLVLFQPRFREAWSGKDADRFLITDGVTDSWIWGATFSRDGQRLLLQLNDNTARLFDAAGRELAVLEHADRVMGAIFLPDGRRILTWSDDGKARLWDQSGHLVAAVQHDDDILLASVSPKGDSILTASRDHTARLWAFDGKELGKYGSSGEVWSATFSPDGHQILTRTDRGANLWSTDRSSLMAHLPHEGASDADYVAEGRLLVTRAHRSSPAIKLWNRWGKELEVLQSGTAGASVAASDGGRYLITRSAVRGQVAGGARLEDSSSLYDLMGGEPIVLGRDEAWEAAVSPQGTRVFSMGPPEPRTPVSGTAESPADALPRAPAGSDPSTADSTVVRAWDLSGGQLAAFPIETQGIAVGGLSVGSDHVLTAELRGLVRVWTADGTLVATLQHSWQGPIDGQWRKTGSICSLSSNDRLILTCFGDQAVRVWTSEGKEQAVLVHSTFVSDAAFTPDNLHVVTAADDGTRLWSLTGAMIVEFKLADGAIATGPLVSPNGQLLLTGSATRHVVDPLLVLWDMSGHARATLSHSANVESFAFSPDSKLVVTTTTDASVFSWSSEGVQLATWQEPSKANSVEFSHDGSRVLTGCDDGVAREWDVEGHLLQEFRGHSGSIAAARYSGDGKLVITHSADRSVRVWRAHPEDLVARADEMLARDFTQEEKQSYADLMLEELPAHVPGAR